jgi:hypothetical protein
MTREIGKGDMQNKNKLKKSRHKAGQKMPMFANQHEELYKYEWV